MRLEEAGEVIAGSVGTAVEARRKGQNRAPRHVMVSTVTSGSVYIMKWI